MVFVLPLVSALVGGFGGQAVLRRGAWVVFLIALAVLIYLGAWLLIEGRRHQGWDGIGYAIWLFLCVVPCGLGLLIGGILGSVRRRRARPAA